VLIVFPPAGGPETPEVEADPPDRVAEAVQIGVAQVVSPGAYRLNVTDPVALLGVTAAPSRPPTDFHFDPSPAVCAVGGTFG
jgi:hypothetical protein